MGEFAADVEQRFVEINGAIDNIGNTVYGHATQLKQSI
jgi:hypothetical protein